MSSIWNVFIEFHWHDEKLNCLSVCPRVGKTESLGLWSKVIVYCFNLSFCKNNRPMGQSFLQKESLLQYTMNLLKGPKDPSVHIFWKKNILSSPYQKGKKMVARHPYLWVSWEKQARLLNYWPTQILGASAGPKFELRICVIVLVNTISCIKTVVLSNYYSVHHWHFNRRGL